MTRVLLLGAGELATIHAAAVRACSGAGVTLAGLFDDDRNAGRRTAGALGVALFDDLEAALGEADAAICCAPLPERTRSAYAALTHGLDVLIETPVAENEHQLQMLIAAIARAPRRPVTMVAHPDLCNPAVEAIAELAADQAVVAFEIETQHPRSGLPPAEGYDIVADLMRADIELMHALLRSPVVATQAAAARSRSLRPLDHARALLVLEDGTLVTLTASCSGAARLRRIRIDTDKARLSCDLDTGAVEAVRTLSIDGGGQIASLVHRVDALQIDPAIAQMRAFLGAVQRRARPRLTIGTIQAAEEIAANIRQRIAVVERRHGPHRQGRIRAA